MVEIFFIYFLFLLLNVRKNEICDFESQCDSSKNEEE